MWQLLLGIFSIMIELCLSMSSCDRMPTNSMSSAMPTDGGFQIEIRMPNSKEMVYRFEPNEIYNIYLTNRRVHTLFRDFYLTAVLKGTSTNKESQMSQGEFIHMPWPRNTRSSGACRHIVTSRRYSYYYSRVKVQWKAPAEPTKCVEFRATVIKKRNRWFKDVGKLTRTLCPTVMHRMMEGNVMGPPRLMPPMIKECCACGVATYNMTFQSLWTKEHHPKDWPTQGGLLHWTNLVGATHDENYLIYHLGGQASPAVQSVCTYGDSSVLQQEFGGKAMKNIRNIIKTRGMWGEAQMNQSRSSLFSVNRTFHLLSFLTMMGPSPDWCTGLAAKDLCQSDCTWKYKEIIDLYPWDAGVRHGNTYMPQNSDRLDYPDPIRQITPNWPSGNPLTPGKPVARITLQRLSPKMDWECSSKAMDGVIDPMMSSSTARIGNSHLTLVKRRKSNEASPLDDPSLAQMATFLCITSDWTPWSLCSVTCGLGRRMRSRVMEINRKNELCRHVKLKEVQECIGRKRTCDFSAKCSLLAWSNWSPCLAACEEEGTQSRTRIFARPEEKAECQGKYIVHETKNCSKPKSECDKVSICSEGLKNEGYHCGSPRTMYSYNASAHECQPFQYRGCKGSMNKFDSKMLCEDTCLEAVAALPKWRRDKMAMLQYQQRARTSSKGKKKMMESMPKKCYLPMDAGHSCQSGATTKPADDDMNMSTSRMWYYNMRTKRCEQFYYQGCQGNDNRFVSMKMCMKSCTDHDMAKFMESAPKHDCVLSEWGHWGPCSQPCSGIQQRWRRITRPSMNGGKPCPELFDQRPCMDSKCVDTNTVI